MTCVSSFSLLKTPMRSLSHLLSFCFEEESQMLRTHLDCHLNSVQFCFVLICFSLEMMLCWGEERVGKWFYKQHLFLQNVWQHRKGVNFLFGEKKRKQKNEIISRPDTICLLKPKKPQDKEKLERILCAFLLKVLHQSGSLAVRVCVLSFLGLGVKGILTFLGMRSRTMENRLQLLNNLLIP